LALALGVTLAAPQTASAAVSSSVSGGGTLSVQSDASDRLVITCLGGIVKINGNNPGSGPAACVAIAAIVVSGGPGANTINLSGVELTPFSGLTTVSVDGNDGDDTIAGTPFADALDGGAGNDRVVGARGDDQMLGDAGDDTLVWNNDDGSETMDGADGTDTVEVNGAAAGGDVFTIKPDSIAGRVAFQRTNLVPFTLDIRTTEKLAVNGSGGDDSISGAAGLKGLIALAFAGGDGNDALTGGDGNDALDGGTGNDRLSSGAGDDRLQGGAGNDSLKSGAGNDSVKGGAGNDSVKRGAGNDALNGGTGRDRLNGGTGDDRLNGGAGRDVLRGGAGSDVLKGGSGKDSFSGGGSNDRISSAGQRGERVNCGGGNDRATGTRGDRVSRSCERVRR